MKSSFYWMPLLLITAGLTGACGEGGGCGGQQASTQPQLTCGQGTHQEGNQCVRNARQ